MALIALFAHEIGHHFHGHLHGGCQGCSDHKIENQADEFAGETLRYLNISLHSSIRLFDHPGFEGGGTHLLRAERKEFFKKGWLKADKAINPEKYKVQQNLGKTLLIGVAILGGGIGLVVLVGAILFGGSKRS